jgi:hypothetical protein
MYIDHTWCGNIENYYVVLSVRPMCLLELFVNRVLGSGVAVPSEASFCSAFWLPTLAGKAESILIQQRTLMHTSSDVMPTLILCRSFELREPFSFPSSAAFQ